MKISYNWLKDYIYLEENPEKVSEILTSIGLEVESIEQTETVKGGLAGVVVGYVCTCEKHPDADKLSVTTVDVGNNNILQIVCGAPNVAKGQKVAVATVGTTLYFASGEEIKIKKSKIRGVESFGMICAEDELGIGESHEGILVLDKDAVPGTPLKDILQIEDETMIEIGLTPNRVDASSHFGVARDIAAYYRKQANLPDVSNFMMDNYSNPYKVAVHDEEGCVRYSGITVSNVKIKPSPEWLQTRLNTIGIKPKNNIVDITNYILHELGQPLHAFDADKIKGKEVVIRTCPEGTEFITLDGETRKLASTDLMICDAERPMCIAGVFGGMDSGVTDETKNVFIESACFNPVRVRKTARNHGLNTDSSFRFERGTDPNMTVYALKRAALLMKELGEGEISSDIVDIYPQIVEPAKIEMTYSNMARVIGKDIPSEEIKSILKALEMLIVDENGDNFSVLVPTYRVDVKREFDVIEDILRIYGYNNIEIPAQVKSTLSYVAKPDKDKVVNIISDFLTSNGYHEIMSNSLSKAAYYDNLETYKAESSVKILNPLSNELNVMRQTLLFGGLEAISRNINRKNANLKFYEFGNCYTYKDVQSGNNLNAYKEDAKLALFITGENKTISWNQKAQQSDFFTLKSILEKLLMRFGISMQNLKTGDVPEDMFRDGFSLNSFKGNSFLNMGVVSKNIIKQFDISQDVFYAELSLSAILDFIKQNKVAYKELARFPEVKRDLALIIDQSVNFSALRNIAIKVEKKLLKNVSLFDIYEGDKLPQGKKQYALSFVLQDEEKTLTDMQIETIMQNLLKAYEREVGAVLR